MKIRQTIAFLFLFLLLSVKVTANPFEIKISGYVTDSQSGEVLPDANIVIGNQSTITNNYGYFVVEVPSGNQCIKASFTGYSPYEQP